MPAAPAARKANWDRLRLLSFVDIAAFHMSGQYLLLGTGLPVFLLLRFTLASRLSPPESTATFVRTRVRSLLLPWAAWSLVFGTLGLLVGFRHGRSLGEMFRPAMLLYGPTEHLWFLPFAAIGGIGVHLLDVATQRVPTRRLAVACGLAGGALAWMAQPGADPLGPPFRQWVFGLPALPLGLGLGRLLARPGPDARRAWAAVGLVAAMAVAWLGLSRLPGAPLTTAPMRYALALVLISGGVLLPDLPGRWIRRITPLLLGGYLLLEPLYSQTLARVERAAGVELAPWMLVGLMVPFTLAAVAALRRTPLRAIL